LLDAWKGKYGSALQEEKEEEPFDEDEDAEGVDQRTPFHILNIVI
jgi:hypothetical protein